MPDTSRRGTERRSDGNGSEPIFPLRRMRRAVPGGPYSRAVCTPTGPRKRVVVSWLTKIRNVWRGYGRSRAASVGIRPRLRLTILLLIDWAGSLLGRPTPVRFLFASGAIWTFTPILGTSEDGTGNVVVRGKREKWS